MKVKYLIIGYEYALMSNLPGKICLVNDDSEVTIKLSPEMIQRVLEVVSDEIVPQASNMGKALRSEIEEAFRGRLLEHKE